jgi:hypothetical protein
VYAEVHFERKAWASGSGAAFLVQSSSAFHLSKQETNGSIIGGENKPLAVVLKGNKNTKEVAAWEAMRTL